MIEDFDWDSYELWLSRYGCNRRVNNNRVKEYFAYIGKPRKKGYCYCCMKEIKDKRRYYCSDKCANEWYSLFVWAIIVKNIGERAGWKCEICSRDIKYTKGIETEPYHIHHIVPISKGGHLFNPANLQFLCLECHRQVHHEMSKKYQLELQKIEYDRKQKKLTTWIETDETIE